MVLCFRGVFHSNWHRTARVPLPNGALALRFSAFCPSPGPILLRCESVRCRCGATGASHQRQRGGECTLFKTLGQLQPYPSRAAIGWQIGFALLADQGNRRCRDQAWRGHRHQGRQDSILLPFSFPVLAGRVLSPRWDLRPTRFCLDSFARNGI